VKAGGQLLISIFAIILTAKEIKHSAIQINIAIQNTNQSKIMPINFHKLSSFFHMVKCSKILGSWL